MGEGCGRRTSSRPILYRLSVELITDIMLLCDSPSRMSSINVRLRQIALGTPILWTNVEVIRAIHCHSLPLFLERSKSAPLHVRLILPAFSPRPTHLSQAQAIEVMDQLRPHIFRIQSLDLNYASWLTPSFTREPAEIGADWANTLISLFDVPAIHLEKLVIESNHNDVIPGTLFLGCMPKLKWVSLNGFTFPSRSDFLHGNFALTHMRVQLNEAPLNTPMAGTQGRAIEPLLYALNAHASSLQNVTLNLPTTFYPKADADYIPPLPYPTSKIAMSHLDSLELVTTYVFGLDVLYAPHLRSFSLVIDYWDDEYTEEEISHMYPAFIGSLTSLSPFLVTHASSLEVVDIRIMHKEGDMLSVASPIIPCDFPRLRHLTIYTNIPFDVISSGIRATKLDSLYIEVDVFGRSACRGVLALITGSSSTLQSLTVVSNDDSIDIDVDSVPRLHLPRLMNLKIHSPFAAILLDHIEATPLLTPASIKDGFRGI